MKQLCTIQNILSTSTYTPIKPQGIEIVSPLRCTDPFWYESNAQRAHATGRDESLMTNVHL
jgi:hypothetical protein